MMTVVVIITNLPDYILKWPHWPNDKDVGFTEACVFKENDDEYLNANKSLAAAVACINEY